MNLAVLFSRLGPYHVARLDAVGMRSYLTALELSGRATEYAWDPVDTPSTFERITLFPEESHRAVSRSILRERIAAALDRTAPDAVVIPGWDDPGALAALQWCRQHNVPRVVMSASSAYDAPRSWWREHIKKQVVKTYDAGIVGGTRHKNYLESLGIPAENTFTGYNVVDNSHFRQGAKEAKDRGSSLRGEIGLPDRYFLAIGRFVPKKNFVFLLEAYASYRKAVEDPWDLVLLGDGPLEREIRDCRSTLGIEQSVKLPGFKQYEALPAYYGLAEAFIHTSVREQWGLVVNEAMAAGLPVAVSDRCGCVPDLVNEPRNGFTFAPDDKKTLVQHLITLSHDGINLRSMGQASQKIIDDWTPDTFARQLLRAAEAARAAYPQDKKTWFPRSALIKALMYR